jgi:methionyl-tRNA formyltransferase
MRIVLCTRGGLHGRLVLERLLSSRDVEVTGIVLSTGTAHEGFVREAAHHVGRSGVAYAAYLWCSTTLADAILTLVGQGSVARRAARLGIPTLSTRRVNDQPARAFVAGCAPALLVSAFFDQLVGAELARVPRLGAVNIHPSPLPDFRGVDPVFFARLRSCPTLGTTVHRLTPQIDAGPILARETCEPIGDESVLAATARLYDRGARLLLDHMGAIANGEPGAVQEGGNYDSWPARGEVASLRARGTRLVRWRDLGLRELPRPG